MISRRTATYHHGDLRAALIRAALKLAKKSGPEGVTLRGVARAAGVSEAAPYHHFADRRELLMAAAAEGFRALGEAVAPAVAKGARSASSDDELVALARAYTFFAVTQRGHMRLILGMHIVDEKLDGARALREAAAPVRDALSHAVTRALPGASDAARARFAQMAWAQVHGVVSLVVEKELHPLPDADGAATLAADAVMLLARGWRSARAGRSASDRRAGARRDRLGDLG